MRYLVSRTTIFGRTWLTTWSGTRADATKLARTIVEDAKADMFSQLGHVAVVDEDGREVRAWRVRQPEVAGAY